MAGYYWQDWTTSSPIPPTAVHGGVDSDGSEIYVGKAFHEGDWLPAKVIPSKRYVSVAHGGGEHSKTQCQVLCQMQFSWVPARGGQVPPGALEGGRTRSGETLYIGRARHVNSLTVGKVHPSHRCIYIPHGNKEIRYDEYEVLVLRN